MDKKQYKTLRQVIDELRASTVGATSQYDIACRFDGRAYSLVNLRNYLEPWLECEAYTTGSGNIKFIPHGGDGAAAYIKIVGRDDDA